MRIAVHQDLKAMATRVVAARCHGCEGYLAFELCRALGCECDSLQFEDLRSQGAASLDEVHSIVHDQLLRAIRRAVKAEREPKLVAEADRLRGEIGIAEAHAWPCANL